MNETVSNSGRDELIARAKERAEGTPTPEEWGYRITLEEGESFVGSWKDRTVDEDHDDRPVYLFLDEAGEDCFSRHYASLERELTREDPAPGDTVVIYRAENYKTRFDDEGEASGQSYGVTTEPKGDPPPGAPAAAADDENFPY